MFLRDAFQVKSGFQYKQLNLRAVNKHGYLEMLELESLMTEEMVNSDYLTAEGDIIVRLTDPYTALYITKEYEGLVVTSNFVIIRNGNGYNPKFVAYYFNGDEVKKQLYSNMQGNIVKSVNITSVENVVLPNISLRRQELYSKLMSTIVEKLKNLEQQKNLELKIQSK